MDYQEIQEKYVGNLLKAYGKARKLMVIEFLDRKIDNKFHNETMEHLTKLFLVKFPDDVLTKVYLKEMEEHNEKVAAWQIKFEENERRIEEMESKINEELVSIWSMDIDNLDLKTYAGKLLIYLTHGWGTDVTLEIPQDVTIETLRLLADKAIRLSGDDHHVFIEDFRVEGDKVYLGTGS